MKTVQLKQYSEDWEECRYLLIDAYGAFISSMGSGWELDENNEFLHEYDPIFIYIVAGKLSLCPEELKPYIGTILKIEWV